MPPESRGDRQSPLRPLLVTHSTPDLPLPTFPSLHDTNSESSPDSNPNPAALQDLGSPSEPASIEDFSLDGTLEHTSFSAASSDEGSEQEDIPNLPDKRPLYADNHSRSHTSLGPSAFAPPFYNRPPTPLPPSPSLTSLLRPTFSTHNSRPNTPDVSSDESTNTNTHPRPTGTNTPTTSTSALYNPTTKPIPRASPRVPTYEYYGFTLYLTSSLAFIIYILWSFLPSPFLHQLGIYYYPNRWWALAIPSWTVMFMVYIYVALAGYNTGYLTLGMESVECIVDEAASVAVVDGRGRIVRGLEGPSWRGGAGGKARDGRGSKGNSRQSSITGLQQLGSGAGEELEWRDLWNEGTDAVMDIPIGGVCEILYGEDYEHDQ